MTDSVQAPLEPTRPGRAIAAMIAGGLIIGLPFAWLLSYLAFLLFYLGLFFCMLCGLLTGAVMFRCGRSTAPMPRRLLWFAGGLVILVVWGAALFGEYRHFPRQVAQHTTRIMSRVVQPDESQRLVSGTAEELRRIFRDKYPPGGFLGYARWMISGDPMEMSYILSDARYTFDYRQQRGFGWIFRVAASLLLLGFGVMSQVLGLAPRRTPPSTEDESPSVPSV